MLWYVCYTMVCGRAHKKLDLASNFHPKFNPQALTPCAFHLVEIFHFVEIQSPFCLYLQNGLEFFNLILQI